MLKRVGAVLVMAVILAAPEAVLAKDRRTITKKKSYQSYQSRSAKTNTHAHGSPWAHERGWANQARGKFVFGLKNTLLGWTELFTEPYEAARNHRNVAVGVGEGLANGFFQTLGGAAHLVTFPITTFDLPLPEGGTQLL
ncbi:MAG: hypothetical protein HYY90_00670 [Candidatus Omnitrophica bacterium]|nr:hypothetical protein [Candidatus Omnitrophota bacterium]